MLDTLYFYGVATALVLLVAFGPLMFMRLRGTSEHIKKSADMMESRVYRAVAGKYGVAPSLVAECLTPEGEAIIGAMTRCDSCGSVEECRHFIDQPGRPGRKVDEAKEICPNADFFIDLAEKLRRKEAGEGQG